MKIPNYDVEDDTVKNFKQLYSFMPDRCFRMLICGPSGSGKTNTLMHMICRLLYFDKVHLYAKNLEQSKYQNILDTFKPISKEVGYNVIEASNDKIIPVGDLDSDSQKIIILKDVTNNTSFQSAVNLKYVNQKLDLKLDKSTFSVANSLPGVPVLDNISIALIPSLSVVTADSNDRVSSWFDPVNNIQFTQGDNDKKPLLKRNAAKRRFFLRFDGTDDFLRKDSFNVRDIAGNNGDTCTVIIICNTKQTKSQSQFQHGRDNNNRFGVHMPWSDSNIYVDFGNVDNGRLLASSLTNLTGNIEVWTIRVTESLLELFRGVTSINPVQTANITANLSSVQVGGNVSQNQELFIGCQVHTNGSATNFCEMDLYGLAMWSKSLSNDELRNMHRFLEDYFDL